MNVQSLDKLRFLTFSELNAPVLLDRAGSLLPLIETVLSKWPFEIADRAPDTPACMTITPGASGDYMCATPETETRPRRWDAVNAVCEMVVELAWEQIRSNPSWLCLHCAAVEFDGRLVLFPNRRRAGKSTLTAVLASRGYRVFTDDFLPVQVDANGYITGRGNGILPRIRLPVPDDFSKDFKDSVTRNPGPQNAQYKYLTTQSLAPRGATSPIGAIVFLDRGEHPECELGAISRPDALDDMISQNFARTLHSGKILQASHGVTDTAELFRLSYGSAEDAADLLETRFRTWSQPVKPIANPRRLQEEGADLSLLSSDKPALAHGVAYRHAGDVTEVLIDDMIYLSDASGLGVHKLNSGSAAIWRLLQQPTSLDELAELLATAFPEVPRDQIERDCLQTLTQFVRNRLIVPTDQAEQPAASQSAKAR